MILIVQNRIQVNKGFEDRFEQDLPRSERAEVPGRLFFALLRSDDPGVYINNSVWGSRAAFQDWRGSDAFKRAHSGGPQRGRWPVARSSSSPRLSTAREASHQIPHSPPA